jgi:hypothetical protein
MHLQEEPPMHTFFISDFKSTVFSSTCFEQLSVHHQEDYKQRYGIYHAPVKAV